MRSQILTVAALSGLSAAAPGGWGDWSSSSVVDPVAKTTTTTVATTTTMAWETWDPKSTSSSKTTTTTTSSTTMAWETWDPKSTSSSTTTSSSSMVWGAWSAPASTASTTYTYPVKPTFSFPGGGKPTAPASTPVGPGGYCPAPSTVTVTATVGGGSGKASSCSSGPSSFPTPASTCLSDAQATNIINTYELLINRNITGAQFNATADKLLSSTYSLTSNSVNADEGIPLNTISIPSKAVFISLFWDIPTGFGETTLDIFHSCDQIAWRWTGTNPALQLVRGITTMTIVNGQIGPVFSEYNNPTLDRCTTGNATSKA